MQDWSGGEKSRVEKNKQVVSLVDCPSVGIVFPFPDLMKQTAVSPSFSSPPSSPTHHVLAHVFFFGGTSQPTHTHSHR